MLYILYNMRLKKKKHNKNNFIAARLNEKEFKRIKLKANLYTEGNLSEWLIHAALNHRPRTDDLEN